MERQRERDKKEVVIGDERFRKDSMKASLDRLLDTDFREALYRRFFSPEDVEEYLAERGKSVV